MRYYVIEHGPSGAYWLDSFDTLELAKSFIEDCTPHFALTYSIEAR